MSNPMSGFVAELETQVIALRAAISSNVDSAIEDATNALSDLRGRMTTAITPPPKKEEALAPKVEEKPKAVTPAPTHTTRPILAAPKTAPTIAKVEPRPTVNAPPFPKRDL